MIGLVEDEPDLAAISRAFLEHEGFQVRAVLDARSAVALLDRGEVEFIVLDLGLPDRNGLHLLRASRPPVSAPRGSRRCAGFGCRLDR